LKVKTDIIASITVTPKERTVILVTMYVATSKILKRYCILSVTS